MRKVGGHVSVAGGLNFAIKNTLEIGGNCLQIFAGSPRLWARSLYSPEVAKSFSDEVVKNSLNPVFIHALYLVNLASDNPDSVKKSITSLQFDLKNADLINAAGVVVHLGSHQGRGFTSCCNQMVEAIKDLLKNIKDTNFIIENSAGQNGKIGTLEEIEELLKLLSSPKVKVCLDTAHLFEAGYDLRSEEEVEKLVNQLEQKKILQNLICIHLNDSKTPLNSHRDQHANIGEGEIGTKGLSNFVNHPKLKHLPLILEVPGEKGLPDKKQITAAKSLTHI